jgi:cellobiose phosphorylase
MDAVQQQLVRPEDRLILLFEPPFDKSSLQPGYIKGYVPGIRENGGQYTHAALWVVQATAMLGQGSRAMELLDLLNPLLRTADTESAQRYRVEPYVLAGDIYSQPPHTGRGGWTWYTGAAGWYYRVAIETVLGFQLSGSRLKMDPCIPSTWPGFELTYRRHKATYRIKVANPHGVERGVRGIRVDGVPQDTSGIELMADGKEHVIEIEMGSLAANAAATTPI